MTGSALALPLLGAGSASAADVATWDRVAECESGGLWSANFGNGLYGGLQFTQETWERHGGLAYASSADLASRAQQITVAERAFAAGGTEWATCAPIAGLTNDGTVPDVDPGPPVTPEEPTGPAAESNRTAGIPAGPSAPETFPSAPATSPAAPSAPASTAPSSPDASATTGAPGTGATPGTSTAPSAPVAPGTGKHRGGAAPETGNADNTLETGTDAGRESGRHASPADGAAGVDGTDGSTKSATPGAGGNNTDTSGTADEYTVQPGDNLTEIAQENELPGGWTALYDANRRTVGADPDLILPGQSLDLSPETVPAQG
ncbi:transglycosylase family protein [Streptomyces sp. NPDC053755]|uniref:transglycosylase family protein n=1 Tax=Streptomyces sp. NPDC053755 TaxID=3155815 RepID=UPI0034366A94